MTTSEQRYFCETFIHGFHGFVRGTVGSAPCEAFAAGLALEHAITAEAQKDIDTAAESSNPAPLAKLAGVMGEKILREFSTDLPAQINGLVPQDSRCSACPLRDVCVPPQL